MSQPYVGEIRFFAGNFAPQGWAFCDGQLLAIADNETLFNLIGTTFGGDGQSTFAVPDFRGRVPVHAGSGAGLSTVAFAESGGAEAVTLTAANLPSHRHSLLAYNGPGNQQSPSGHVWAQDGAGQIGTYVTGSATLPMAGASGPSGGSQPHNNMSPYVCISFIISLFGIFPSQN